MMSSSRFFLSIMPMSCPGVLFINVSKTCFLFYSISLLSLLVDIFQAQNIYIYAT